MDTGAICLLLAIGLPLVGFLLPAWAGSKWGPRVAWLALAFPLVAFGALLTLALSLHWPARLVIEIPWIPTLGINLSFLVDGLSLFFGLVVSGMGCLIFFYAGHYLDEHFEHHGRFYSYLVLFMAAMLGTVFANNLLMMFVFWELTGLASFLLIGFLHGEESSRVGARQALVVTAGTGLALLAGLIMIYAVTGTYDFHALAGAGLPWSHYGGWLTVAMGLVLLGAFGKSAQFPLHFWLPNAMAAPTPVSAYLHSATMVKLGVFLCARLFPLFAEQALWAPLVSIVGFTTMAFCAVLALLAHDLKAILAFSTCSQLGYLIGYYGLGPAEGVEYDYLHIFNHVLYKGSLFMIVGVVAHAAGIRDIRQLGGLFRRLPLLGSATLVAAAAMAGLPGTTGFLSKEMMLKEIFEALGPHEFLSWFATACVLLTSLVKVAFSTRLFVNIFLGPEPPEIARQFHAPSLWMQLPPAILAGAALLFGVAPALLDAWFQPLAVAGLNRPGHLALWHGFTRELLASTLIVIAGFGLYWLGVRTRWRWHEIPRSWQFDRFFETALEGLAAFAKALTRFVRSDSPTAYLPVVLGFVILTVGGTLAWHFGLDARLLEQIAAADWPRLNAMRSLVAALIVLAVGGVLVLQRWTTQLISLSVAGFLICFYFVLYRAPDLALTQILVEVVTLFLILLLLGRFPKSAEEGEVSWQAPGWRQAINAGLAAGVGILTTALILVATSQPAQQRLGDFFLAQTVPLAEGRNAVNTILVDFRGFDTLGEIAVLLIATLGGLGLLMRYKRTREEYQQGPLGPPGFGTLPPEKEEP
ncbi:MAG: proton-conducting transporter membrane subunit [Verrucomicrobiae bacterium]|nr:proton-conducting transporter membrane subunit [Verrucomicrobiae bacterium]